MDLPLNMKDDREVLKSLDKYTVRITLETNENNLKLHNKKDRDI